MTQNPRAIWLIKLNGKFFDALKKSTEGFTWKEKADFLELLIEYVGAIKRDAEQAAEFFSEKIMKPFKSKLKPAASVKLFEFFEKDFSMNGLPVLLPELFDPLSPSEYELTDEEHTLFLHNCVRALKTDQYFHYIYAHSEDEENPKELNGTGVSTQNHPNRRAGDNLTRLTQEQTALLAHYLKEGRLFLSKDYLTDKAAGYAFFLLTGYSLESLRIKLNPKEIARISTHENLNELHVALTRITILINKDIKKP